MMSDEQELLQQSLAGLSPEERAQVLKILQQYAQEGESALEQDIKWADWEEIPVDIETFLHDKQYLGKGLYDNEGRFTVFPFWEEKLKDIFPTNTTTRYNTIIFSGAIGIGKSFVAVICILYMLYRLLCLKDPYTYFGMQVIDKISISFMNITIENAKGVALDKMNQLILASDWFMAHGEMRGTTNLVYHPDKHIEFIASSSNNQIVGRALFCLDGNTTIKTTKGYYKLVDLVDKDIQVISIDNNGKEIISDTCAVKPTVKTSEEYQIELEDGTIIKCTPNHKLLLKNGLYKEAQYLTEDDELFEHQETYNEFINKIIQSRGQWNKNIRLDGCERHHIKPKCLGGAPKKLDWTEHQNIIWLTPEEHFIAHKLLAYEHPNNYKLVTAFKRMCYSNKHKCLVTEQNISFIKQNWGQLHSQQLKGTTRTHYNIKDPVIFRAQKAALATGEKNNMYQCGYKIVGEKNGCYGRPVEPERLYKIKKARSKYIYTYDNKDFFGWVDLKKYLNALGYPISQAGIEACVAGRNSIKNKYPNLYLQITKKLKEDAYENN